MKEKRLSFIRWSFLDLRDSWRVMHWTAWLFLPERYYNMWRYYKVPGTLLFEEIERVPKDGWRRYWVGRTRYYAPGEAAPHSRGKRTVCCRIWNILARRRAIMEARAWRKNDAV